jgi:pimeloyl-ACP methyl ester carboxylesterase/predicted glycosyltransferase
MSTQPTRTRATSDEVPPTAVTGEQTRARYPDAQGHLDRNGVRVFWERYGEGEPAILFLPTWEITHSRSWKCQIPYFARHGCVVTFDPRGNGRSDRPTSVHAYDRQQLADDAIAVLDAAGIERAAVVSWCAGSEDLILATEHPDRVTRLVAIAPDLFITEDPIARAGYSFDDELDTDEGWAKWNRRYWERDWAGFVRFFFGRVFSEPHSTKQIEDALGWGLETNPQTVLLGMDALWKNDREQALELCGKVSCPTLVIQGTADEIVGPERGPAMAAAIDRSQLVMLEGCGHGTPARDPVKINQLIRSFLCPPPIANRWRSARARPKRALYISSPIGLGHAHRDIAIADELRALHPGLQIDWLAQHPVTEVLQARGERIHPMSADLANESRHIQRESHGHELHAFQALRRMDEIQLANFMVFQDLVRAEPFDLWIGDEAWEVDFYLHENPEVKRAPFAWLTDFVGYLPMAGGGEREAVLTADYNAEMIEHIARYPHVRDVSIFVGDADDIVPDRFGTDLPGIREWTVEHFDFSGYVTGFPRYSGADREELRRELGYAPDERVCVVTVGGSGVGTDLLRRVVAAYPEAKRRVPALRMVVVAGPRIDPRSLSVPSGVELHAYVDDLYRHLAACDLGVVQGGLATCMELVASGRPFLYFPLKNHFEQDRHVHHRLQRHQAGRRMEYESAGVSEIAAAIAEEIDRDLEYLTVAADGAAKAARLIAELI